jgi:putative ATP-dependent endonuclease of the OLD family
LIDFQNQLNFVESIGRIDKKVTSGTLHPPAIDEDGKNLVNSMHTMHTDNYARFIEIVNVCKKIFPDIHDIHPKMHSSNYVSIVIKKKNVSSEIDLAYEGAGIEQLLIIIWKIATSEPPAIWFLDEPELHLHPGAQKLLYDFLKDETKSGKQIIVTTQSMVFIHKSELDEVSIILNDEYPSISLLKDLVSAEEKVMAETHDIIRNHIYDALGYEPKFSFEPEKIIVVEGKSDKNILSAFSERLGSKIDPRRTVFIPLGDKQAVEKYSPILAYTLSNKKCLIILDNDKKDPETIRDQIIQKEKRYKDLIGAKAILNGTYSIENYLLDAEAIYKAAQNTLNDQGEKINLCLTFEEIKAKIKAENIGGKNPKEILINIWGSCGCGNYREDETGTRIVACMSKERIEKINIVNLVNRMNE